MLKRLSPPFLIVLIYILVIIALSGAGLVRTTGSITAEITAVEQRYRRVDDTLEGIRREFLTVAVLFRDVLFDRDPAIIAGIRDHERRIRQQVEVLNRDLHSSNAGELQRLQSDLDAYFTSIYRTFELPPAEARVTFDAARGKRQSVILIAEKLNDLNERDFEGRQQDIQKSMRNLRREIIETIVIAILLSAAAACVALIRVWDLEKENRAALLRTAEARQKLESLSRQLVTAQENERKSLSRELHDEIGQSLTALKLELAKCERLARGEGSQTVDHLKSTRDLADQTLRATRAISLGLRPPMLDDLGLAAALNWFTSEFSSRSGIQVQLEVDGDIAELSESHRTCVYRIVQEALTNCARHAHATTVEVQIEANDNALTILLRDDGTGFDAARKLGSGLGLLSMRERAAELGGDLEITSELAKGTTIWVRIPCPRPAQNTGTSL